MKGRLANKRLPEQQNTSGASVDIPAIIFDPRMEQALGNIHASRREIAREFCSIRLAQKLKFNSVMNYCKAIATLETVGKDFRSITKQEMVAWVTLLDQTYKPATAQLYRFLVKNFIRWAYYSDNEDAEYPESVRWIKTQKLKQPYEKHVLSKDEAYRLIRTADNQRDRALLFCLYESGCRAGEILGLRIKDVTIKQTMAEIRVNGKTGPRPIPLIESVSDLQLWLSMHPYADNPEYSMWPVNRKSSKGMKYSTLFWQVCKAANEAGLPKGISPHSLRHASATHKSETLNESQLRLYYGWERDSKMPSKYVHQDEKSLRTALRKYSGMPAEEEIHEIAPTKPKTCSRCHKENSAFACFCMQCGLALDVKTAMGIEDKIRKADGIQERLNEFLMERAPGLLKEFLDRPEIKQTMDEVVTGNLTSNNDEVIKFIL